MPLKVNDLQKALQKSFEEVFAPAFEEAFRAMLPETSKKGKDKASEFGEIIKDQIAEPMSTRMAEAIDYYIKNADVYGTIITVGGMTTQTASINSPSPITNGKVPNTFGIK